MKKVINFLFIFFLTSFAYADKDMKFGSKGNFS